MTRQVRPLEAPEDVSPHAGVGQWFIDSPGDHPIWNQYVALLMHLRSVEGLGAPNLHGDYGYEWQLYAVDPKHRLPEKFPKRGIAQLSILTPPNFGYQFNADNDAVALERVEKALNDAPSLDTDYRAWMNARFTDGYSLVRRDQALMDAFGLPQEDAPGHD